MFCEPAWRLSPWVSLALHSWPVPPLAIQIASDRNRIGVRRERPTERQAIWRIAESWDHLVSLSSRTMLVFAVTCQRKFPFLEVSALGIFGVERNGTSGRSTLNDGEDTRQQQKRRERGRDQPADHGPRQRCRLFPSFAEGQRHGHHARDHG